jgi:4-hydroxybenzoate polyprenyltransferase
MALNGGSFNLFSSLLRLARFWNLAIIGLAQYFTSYFLIGGHTITDWHLLVLSTSTILIAAAGYVINDYYDVKIDLINKPERVVVGKNITRRYAILLHTVLSFTGVVLGVFLGWKILAINFLSSFSLWWYSNQLKRLPFVGNFMVAILTGLSILLLSVLYKNNNPLIFIYSLFAFFITLVREVVKDMEDLKGDNTFGCKTLPIIWGIRKTKVLLYVLIAVFSVTVLLLNHFYSRLPALYFTLCLFGPVGFLLVRLVRADTVKQFYQLSQLCKVIMVLGILSMIFI